MNRLARFSLATLLANLGVILWGAYVRASGSGAGCGSHWPLCNGEVVPHSPGFETFVELTHRLTSGIALLMVIVLVVAAFRSRPAGDPTRSGSVAVLLLMLTEAGVGAGIVLFELVVDNSSAARAAVMVVHLLNTFLLLAASTLTTLWANGAPGLDLKRSPLTTRWFSLACLGTLLVGATGAIAALGDTLFPVATLAEGLEQHAAGAHWLLRLRSLHPASAIVVGLFLIRLPRLVSTPDSNRASRRLGQLLAFGVLLQLAAGTLNIFLLVPIWLQLVHLALADAVWIVLILYGHALLASESTSHRRESEEQGRAEPVVA